MSESCNSTGNGRLMRVEHGFKTLSQPVPEIIPNLAILAAHEAQIGPLGS